MTDAVEKGLSMPPARNYRINGTDILNRSCAFHAGLESILLGEPSQNPFSTPSTHLRHGRARELRPNANIGQFDD
jgi:hypothetical protein